MSPLPQPTANPNPVPPRDRVPHTDGVLHTHGVPHPSGAFVFAARVGWLQSALSTCKSTVGNSTIELAFVLPVFLTFVFGLMSVCRAFYTYELISECAREGARYAIVHGSTCTTGTGASCTLTSSAIDSYVSSTLKYPNLGGGGKMVVNTTFTPNNTPGSTVQVVVTENFPYSIPFLPAKTLSLSSTSKMQILQ